MLNKLISIYFYFFPVSFHTFSSCSERSFCCSNVSPVHSHHTPGELKAEESPGSSLSHSSGKLLSPFTVCQQRPLSFAQQLPGLFSLRSRALPYRVVIRAVLFTESSGVHPSAAAAVTLDRSLKLSLVRFLPLESTEINGTSHMGWLKGLCELTHVKHLEQCLAYSNFTVIVCYSKSFQS